MSINGSSFRGRHLLHVYKAKHERLLAFSSFLLSTPCENGRCLVIADAQSVAMVDAIFGYAGSTFPMQACHGVCAEDFAYPGELLDAAGFLDQAGAALIEAEQRFGDQVCRMVVDTQYVASHMRSPQDLTAAVRGLKSISAERSIDILSLFFVEHLPRFELQQFVDQFDEVYLCDSLKRLLAPPQGSRPQLFDRAVLRMALKQETVLQKVLRIDASEPIGSVDAPVVIDGELPQLTDLIEESVLLLDTAYSVVFCNNAAATFIGLNRADIVGCALFSVLDPDIADRLIRTARVVSLAEATIGFLVRLPAP